MTIVHHLRYHEHRQTIGHPESPERLDAVVARLKAEDLWKDVLTPEPVGRSLLEKVHTPEYIDSLKNFGEYNRLELVPTGILIWVKGQRLAFAKWSINAS